MYTKFRKNIYDPAASNVLDPGTASTDRKMARRRTPDLGAVVGTVDGSNRRVIGGRWDPRWSDWSGAGRSS